MRDIPWETPHPFLGVGLDGCGTCGMSPEHECHDSRPWVELNDLMWLLEKTDLALDLDHFCTTAEDRSRLERIKSFLDRKHG